MTDALAEFRDTVLLWRTGLRAPFDVVLAACDLIVAGAGQPSVVLLASVERTEAATEVARLAPAVFAELGLGPGPWGASDPERPPEDAGFALIRLLLAGRITPRWTAQAMHAEYGHTPGVFERLSTFDDEYDCAAYGGLPAAEIDAGVLAEARRIAGQTQG